MNKKTLIFMKTHFIDDAVLSEYKKLSNSLSENQDCILFIDNHTNFLNISETGTPIVNINIKNENIKCFLYDEKIQAEMNLTYYTDDIENKDLAKLMWYNSDYPFYIIKKYLPNYEYYWSIEYDVFCNGNSYEPFFSIYENNEDDLISQDYSSTVDNDPIWHWINGTEWIYTKEEIHKAFFPVVRLSAKAIDFLYNRRIEHGRIFEKAKEKSNHRWIFCECFVATELYINGFKCSPILNQNIRFLPVYNLNKERIFENPDFKLYHPVK